MSSGDRLTLLESEQAEWRQRMNAAHEEIGRLREMLHQCTGALRLLVDDDLHSPRNLARARAALDAAAKMTQAPSGEGKP